MSTPQPSNGGKPSSFQILTTLTGNKKPKKSSSSDKKLPQAKFNKLRYRTISLAPLTEAEENTIRNSLHQTGPNSIQSVINQCHPDIRTLLNRDNVASYKVECHSLTIDLHSGIRVVIESMSYRRKRYIVSNGRKNIIFDRIVDHHKIGGDHAAKAGDKSANPSA